MGDDAFPLVRIERWTGIDGWWTFKVLYVASKEAEPDPLDAEFETVERARKAAKTFAEFHGNCPIVESD